MLVVEFVQHFQMLNVFGAAPRLQQHGTDGLWHRSPQDSSEQQRRYHPLRLGVKNG